MAAPNLSHYAAFRFNDAPGQFRHPRHRWRRRRGRRCVVRRWLVVARTRIIGKRRVSDPPSKVQRLAADHARLRTCASFCPAYGLLTFRLNAGRCRGARGVQRRWRPIEWTSVINSQVWTRRWRTPGVIKIQTTTLAAASGSMRNPNQEAGSGMLRLTVGIGLPPASWLAQTQLCHTVSKDGSRSVAHLFGLAPALRARPS